jgi:copper resistance protein D
LDDPLIYVRAIHFAATMSAVGVVFFVVFVAEPAFRQSGNGTRASAAVRGKFQWIAWLGLLATVLSGGAWLVLVAQSMSDRALADVFSEGILWTVLSDTSFGRDWMVRFAIACLLAGFLPPFLSPRGDRPVWLKVAVVALAVGLIGALALAGHAVGASGIEGFLHPAADALHLVAAAAWVGTLLPLALLLGASGHDAAPVEVVCTATLRFSVLGIASVATLFLTGAVNTWYLTGSMAALTETDYGRLLLTKIALFLGMIAVAAVNRLWLTPRLVQGANAAAKDALRQLRRNTFVEVAAGAVIIAIVAVLGVSPPGQLGDVMQPPQHHSH